MGGAVRIELNRRRLILFRLAVADFDHFPTVPPQFLTWQHRSRNLIKELDHWDGEIVCLQVRCLVFGGVGCFSICCVACGLARRLTSRCGKHCNLTTLAVVTRAGCCYALGIRYRVCDVSTMPQSCLSYVVSLCLYVGVVMQTDGCAMLWRNTA